jgi:hypothetical protein
MQNIDFSFPLTNNETEKDSHKKETVATVTGFHGFLNYYRTPTRRVAPDAGGTLKSLNHLTVRLDGALVHPGSGQVRALNGVWLEVSDVSKHPALPRSVL